MNGKQIYDLRKYLPALRNVYCTNCGMNKWIIASYEPLMNGDTLDITSRCCKKKDYRI